MRIRDWRIVILFLLACGLVEWSWASCPLLVHADASDQREFMNVCQQMAASPAITISAGAPGFAPRKTGDIDISTTTAKVYIATAAATSLSWVIVN